jgi:hypothetical protein
MIIPPKHGVIIYSLPQDGYNKRGGELFQNAAGRTIVFRLEKQNRSSVFSIELYADELFPHKAAEAGTA